MYGIHPEHWGKGYATEAAKRCLDFGFIDLGLERIYDYTLPDNLRAINVMKKLGMKYVKNFNHKGFDHVLYEIDSPHQS
jgi:ribosomal-protein-alanine N-acetyltransferase